MAITESTQTAQPQATQPVADTNDLNLKLDHFSPEEKKAELDLSIQMPTTENTTDRLKQEDEATKKASNQSSDIQILSKSPLESSATQTTFSDIIGTNLPSAEGEKSASLEKNITPSSLQDDLKIIKDLEKTETIIPATQEKKDSTINSPSSILNSPSTSVQPTTMNLDSILGTTSDQPSILNPQPSISQSSKSPFDLIKPTAETQIPMVTPTTTQTQTATSATTPKNKGVKIALFAMLFVAMGFTGYFILKTMYPVEFGTTTTNGVAIATGADLTGAQLTGTELTGEVIATQTGEIQDHGSADEMFSDLSDLNANAGDQTAIRLSQLTTYAEQGKLFFERGKQINDKTMMKFGGYIWKKADAFIIGLESGTVLDNSMLPNYLAQFSGYLAQLQALETNALSSPTDIPTTDTTQTQDGSFAPTE